jgi:hypothetical protein
MYVQSAGGRCTVQEGRETESLAGIYTGGQAERCINSEVDRHASRKVIMWAGRQVLGQAANIQTSRQTYKQTRCRHTDTDKKGKKEESEIL